MSSISGKILAFSSSRFRRFATNAIPSSRRENVRKVWKKNPALVTFAQQQCTYARNSRTEKLGPSHERAEKSTRKENDTKYTFAKPKWRRWKKKKYRFKTDNKSKTLKSVLMRNVYIGVGHVYRLRTRVTDRVFKRSAL